MAVLPPDPVFILRSPDMGPVNSLTFHKNERLLAGTAKGTIHLWDLQTNRSTYHFDVDKNPITSLHHTNDDNLISQEKGGSIKFWSLTNSRYELKSSYECNHSAFCRTDYISEIDTLIVPKNENEIGLISLSSSNCEINKIFKIDNEQKLGHISSLKAINLNGQYYIFAGYECGDILIWDIRSSKIINQINFGNEMPISIDYDIKINRGICGGSSNKIFVFLYSLQTNKIQKKL